MSPEILFGVSQILGCTTINQPVFSIDVFDALTSARVYKPPWPVPRAVAEIDGAAGRMFDPVVVNAFRKLCNERRFDQVISGLR